MQEQKKPWFNFMTTNGWVVFIDIIRILIFVAMVVLIFIMIKEIDAIKIMAYDPCEICMSKTGCSCFCLN